jgi:hypothetical protein
LKHVEGFIRQDSRGVLAVTSVAGGISEQELRRLIVQDGCSIVSWGVSIARNPQRCEVRCEIQWRQRNDDASPPAVIASLCASPGVAALSWEPQGLSGENAPRQPQPQGTPVAISDSRANE